jgi:hypothetical protein
MRVIAEDARRFYLRARPEAKFLFDMSKMRLAAPQKSLYNIAIEGRCAARRRDFSSPMALIHHDDLGCVQNGDAGPPPRAGGRGDE